MRKKDGNMKKIFGYVAVLAILMNVLLIPMNFCSAESWKNAGNNGRGMVFFFDIDSMWYNKSTEQGSMDIMGFQTEGKAQGYGIKGTCHFDYVHWCVTIADRVFDKDKKYVRSERYTLYAEKDEDINKFMKAFRDEFINNQ